jgi:hypothetical protein
VTLQTYILKIVVSFLRIKRNSKHFFRLKMLQLTLDINRVLRNSGQQTKVVYLLVGIHGLGNIYTVMSQAKRFAKRVVHFFVSYEISLNVSRLKSTFLFEVGPGDNNKNSLTASNSITGAPTTNTQHTQKSQETQCS